MNLKFHDTRHTFAKRLRANGVHEWDIRDLLGHASVRMTSVYMHQTPANLCHAVKTLGQTKPGKVVRFKQRSVSGSSNPSATADDTDLMTRESCPRKTITGGTPVPLAPPKSRHLAVEHVSTQQHEDVSVRQLAG